MRRRIESYRWVYNIETTQLKMKLSGEIEAV